MTLSEFYHIGGTIEGVKQVYQTYCLTDNTDAWGINDGYPVDEYTADSFEYYRIMFNGDIIGDDTEYYDETDIIEFLETVTENGLKSGVYNAY